MGIIQTELAKKKILVSDGAWGTMLQSNGLTPSDCPEEWNVSHAEVVKGIAAAYYEAGSDIILTNTFGGSPVKLEKMGLGDRVDAFNMAGAANSLAGAPGAIVAASVGPTGELPPPLGTLSLDELEAIFSKQISAILAAGVNAICVETMSSLDEAACAIRAAKNLDPAVEVIATMTFEHGKKGYRTMMGVTPEQAAESLGAAGADIVGANCGNGIEQMIPITRLMRERTDKPILVHANAGVPEIIDGETVFRQSPDDMAARIEELADAGASIIGGCCGTTPAHIAAIKTIINDLRA